LTRAANITVFNPAGDPPPTARVSLAARPATLDGGVLYLVDCRFEAGDRLLAQIRDWFAEHLPAVETKTVRWRRHGFEPDDETLAQVASDGRAAIMGVGI
jgi:hypothetical protein